MSLQITDIFRPASTKTNYVKQSQMLSALSHQHKTAHICQVGLSLSLSLSRPECLFSLFGRPSPTVNTSLGRIAAPYCAELIMGNGKFQHSNKHQCSASGVCPHSTARLSTVFIQRVCGRQFTRVCKSTPGFSVRLN